MSKSKTKLYAVTFACVAVVLLQYVYFDCADFVRNSVNVWHALFDSQPFNFYQYTRFLEHNQTFPSFSFAIIGASYPYYAYFVSAIWNFPLFLIERFMAADLFATPWAVVYAKAGLILVSFVNAFLLQRIARKALPAGQENDYAWLPLAYLTSNFFFSCTVAVGQIDVYTVLFALLGFERYLQKKWTYVIFFALAFPVKYLIIFSFIPLLLLEEKNILRIAGKVILFMSLTTILSVLFYQDQSAQVGILANTGQSIHDNAVNMLSGSAQQVGLSFPIGTMTVHWFFAAYLILMIYCYLQKPETTLRRGQVGAFAAMVGMLAFLLLFYPVNPYWAILVLPFSLLAVAFNPGSKRKMLLTETAASTIFVLWQMFQYNWVFGYYAMRNNVFLYSGSKPGTDSLSIASITDQIGSMTGLPVTVYMNQLLSTTAIMLLVYYAWLLFPRKSAASLHPANSPETQVFWIRLAASTGTMAIAIGSIYIGLLVLRLGIL